MSKEYAIETVREAIGAWGLGYAIEGSNLDSDDVADHEELAELVEVAYEAMRKIKVIVRR